YCRLYLLITLPRQYHASGVISTTMGWTMFSDKLRFVPMFLFSASALAAQTAYTITGIVADSRDSSGYARAEAVAINNSGQVLGDTDDYSPTGAWLGYHTVLWENGSITDLPSL